MRLTIVPPYRGAGYAFEPHKEPYYERVLTDMRARGELDGVDLTIDPGAHTDHRSDSRDEEVFQHLGTATLERVKAIGASGDCDAIVVLGSIDVAFHATRLVSPVPVTYPMHSAVHVASLVSDRFSLIDVTDPQAARIRRLVRGYGFGDRLGSIRVIGRSSTEISPLLRDITADSLTPEVDQLLDELVEQSSIAVEVDRAESLIIGFTPFQALRDELTRRLEAAGFGEIPLVWILSAAVACARVMVATGLLQAARSYPSDSLVLKPSFR